ncbi:MAG TPA: hypothetical protein VKW08_18170 [Xanthobacteraceae bacterium]|nr:hypothetical protein [Xanthobacteraceae bacterium]
MNPIVARDLQGPDPMLRGIEAIEDDGTHLEIEAEFRRRISGLRRLPRHARAQALRFAREQRFIALAALREKRQRERQGRSEALRQRLPGPGPTP